MSYTPGVILDVNGNPIASGTAAPTGTERALMVRQVGGITVTSMPTTPVTGAFYQATQPVSLATNTPDVTDRAARVLGVVTQAALTKGTQGTNGLSVQQLVDAGRNQVHFYTLIPVLTSATDTLQSLTGTKSGATVAATTTPAVVTAGKVLRITRITSTYISTATSGYAVVRLRFRAGGVAQITDPIAATVICGNAAPTVANAVETTESILDGGWEFAAGVGIGVSVQGMAAATPTAVGYVAVAITGWEY